MHYFGNFNPVDKHCLIVSHYPLGLRAHLMLHLFDMLLLLPDFLLRLRQFFHNHIILLFRAFKLLF